MVRCPRCGYVSDNPAQCPNCGLLHPQMPAGATPPGPPPRRAWWGGAATGAVVALIIVAMAAGSFWYLQRDDDKRSTEQPQQPRSKSTEASDSPSTAKYNDFADVYAKVGDGVGEVKVETCDGSGTGTGFLIGARRMVTAAHVINGANKVRVKMDGQTISAAIEGVDKSIDLAVLTLEESGNGHIFELDADQPRTGTRLAAIGYPLGEPKALTEGTISGSGREVQTESGTFTDMLQTDTAINPGNSGGPLVNLKGKVVGIAAAVRTDAQGIGYAVPSNTIQDPLADKGALTPVNRVGCDFDTEAPDDAVEAVYAYHQAINSADYDAAIGSLTRAFARANFSDEAAWYKAYETTYDDQFEVIDSSPDGDRTLVRMRFRSQQAPGYGPKGAKNATCLKWDVEYHLVQSGGEWLIEGADGHGDPAWTRC